MESLDISIPHQISVCSHDIRGVARGRARPNKAKLACRVISAGAFLAWTALMVTVVAEGCRPLTILAITLLPFLAHIVTVTLTAMGRSAEADQTP